MKNTIAIFLLMLSMFGQAQFGNAEEYTQKAVISYFTGKVEAKLSGAAEWKKADHSIVLTEGDMLRTGKDARAIIDIKDKDEFITVDMQEDSELRFLTFDIDPRTGAKTTLLDLSMGEIEVTTLGAGSNDSKFEIKTPTSMVDLVNGDTSVKVTVTRDF